MNLYFHFETAFWAGLHYAFVTTNCNVAISAIRNCDFPNKFRSGIEQFLKNLRMSKPIVATRDKHNCVFADGSERTYPIENNDWINTPYPMCSLPIKFHLYRPMKSDAVIINAVNNESTATSFEKAQTELSQLKNRSRPLFFITHGYLTASVPNWALEMKNALLDLGYNVVLVEWYSAWKLYIDAVADTRLVSDVLAVFIDELIQRNLVNIEQIVLVGHSIGAHISGMTAKRVIYDQIKAIIGLDPAGPFFDCHGELGLSKNSAPFVQALHTDFNGLLLNLGTDRSLGHIDYFVNPSRSRQPGCFDIYGENIEVKLFGCSHFRANALFTQIINSQKRAEWQRIESINDRTVCQLSAKHSCEGKDTYCVAGPRIKVLSLSNLLDYTLKGTQPNKLGRFEVLTTSKGAEAEMIIYFSKKKFPRFIEIMLVEIEGHKQGPFTRRNMPNSPKYIRLKVLLPAGVEYHQIEVVMQDSSDHISGITLILETKEKYAADIKTKTIDYDKTTFLLRRKK